LGEVARIARIARSTIPILLPQLTLVLLGSGTQQRINRSLHIERLQDLREKHGGDVVVVMSGAPQLIVGIEERVVLNVILLHRSLKSVYILNFASIWKRFTADQST
jgi:hypothetical protein